MTYSYDNINWSEPESMKIRKTLDMSNSQDNYVYVRYLDSIGKKTVVYRGKFTMDLSAEGVDIFMRTTIIFRPIIGY
jgi:hypothetical protein